MSTDLRGLGNLIQAQSPRPAGGRALLLAAVAEAILIGVIVWETAQQRTPPPPALPPMQLQLVKEEPPKPTPPAPKPPVSTPPKPTPKPTPKPQPRPLPHPAPRPKPAPAPVREVLPPSPLPSPVQAPPAPPVTPTPPPPAPANPAVKADYLAQVKGAIQAAVHFPDAARMLGQGGRVQVEFTLQDGVITGLRILRKGSMDSFNSAALSAVREARLPALPPELKGKRFQLELWVEFVLHSND
ncbi:TonB family protein [Acidithiobacillus sp. CV18-2]|uniref:TonB family protein n=1 Tax=Igneacidithiobacillus copahuensis TaxID=2724909 RepID=A0AAE2YRB4_9PROT|nr:energy transducer TonB [Igneacidithiobacillus copahuensis]MBU2753317.1 TonB family protein [Acidithiobacillus sp. CV18-3]MBU2756347.1 TonB family protein [Acidithiobacillus sp. BN09-2]MBU2776134.1 TonB family protein [Acidithiobacillus sp. CV18-2]MBU2795747.1 TonB family protein [Acidithiobacillus sp. VAN18-2]MBU2798741.1 TonB family protein [Acidithiobacillus sp. VAN18-4]UTV81641.1 energy transducer TonB [Acidithiobacillus sp. YTS05]